MPIATILMGTFSPKTVICGLFHEALADFIYIITISIEKVPIIIKILKTYQKQLKYASNISFMDQP